MPYPIVLSLTFISSLRQANANAKKEDSQCLKSSEVESPAWTSLMPSECRDDAGFLDIWAVELRQSSDGLDRSLGYEASRVEMY